MNVFLLEYGWLLAFLVGLSVFTVSTLLIERDERQAEEARQEVRRRAKGPTPPATDRAARG